MIDPSDLTSVTKELDSLMAAQDGIERISASVAKYPLFEVHCVEVIESLTTRIAEIRRGILEHIERDAIDNVGSLAFMEDVFMGL